MNKEIQKIEAHVNEELEEALRQLIRLAVNAKYTNKTRATIILEVASITKQNAVGFDRIQKYIRQDLGNVMESESEEEEERSDSDSDSEQEERQPEDRTRPLEIFFAYPGGDLNDKSLPIISRIMQHLEARPVSEKTVDSTAPCLIFYMVVGGPKFDRGVVQEVKKYQRMCKNVVCIRMHTDGDQDLKKDIEWLPSSIRGRRVFGAHYLRFTPEAYGKRYSISPPRAFFIELNRIVSMASA